MAEIIARDRRSTAELSRVLRHYGADALSQRCRSTAIAVSTCRVNGALRLPGGPFLGRRLVGFPATKGFDLASRCGEPSTPLASCLLRQERAKTRAAKKVRT